MGNEPKKQSAETPTKGSESKDNDQSSAPVVRAEVQLPQTLVDKYNADQQQTYRLQQRQARFERWKYRHLERPSFRFERLAVVGVFAYATVALLQWCASYQANNLTRQNFEASERPYLSLGRADGIIAEFADSKDPNGKVGLKIYIKNGGRLPALNVSPSVIALTIPPIAPAANYNPHPTFARSRNKTNGSEQTMGGDTIAGDSTYVFFVPNVLPQADVGKIKDIKSGTLFMVRGEIPYCDSLGEAFCKQFTLYYQSDPLSGFSSIGLEDCWLFMGNNALPSKDPNVENLPPCETPQEYEQRQKRLAAAIQKGAAQAALPSPTAIAPTK